MSEQKYFDFQLNDIKRKLPYVKIKEDLALASFVVISDTELVCEAAKQLKELLPEIDMLVTAEAKGICLCFELSRIMGMKEFIVARKTKKPYMVNPVGHTVCSITTQKEQTLWLDGSDAEKIKGKRVALIDDVIAVGESIAALEALVEAAGAEVAAKACICAELETVYRDDVIYLKKHYVFRPEEDGTFTPIESLDPNKQ